MPISSALNKGGANACGEFKTNYNGLLKWLDVTIRNGGKWIIQHQKLLGLVLQADHVNQYYPPRRYCLLCFNWDSEALGGSWGFWDTTFEMDIYSI